MNQSLYMHVEISSDWFHLLLIFITTIANGLVPSIVSILTGKIFNLLNDSTFYDLNLQQKFYHILVVRSMSLMIIGVSSLPVSWASISLWMALGEKQGFRVRKRILLSYLNKPMSYYDFNEKLFGDFTQLNRCTEELRAGSAEASAMVFQSVITVISLIITSFYTSWQLTLVIIASTPIVFVVSTILSKLIEKYTKLENTRTSDAAQILSWTMNSAQMIRLFGTQLLETENFKACTKKCSEFFIKFSLFSSMNYASLRFFTLCTFVQGFWFGNIMIKQGKLDTGDVITCFSSCILLGSAINNTSHQFVCIQKGRVALLKILEFIQNDDCNNTMADTSIPSSPLSIGFSPLSCHGDIIFKDVTFSYPLRPNSSALKNISLHFPSKKTTFVIGKSGSGKSTISNLLLKLYLNYKGTVTMDGIDIQCLENTWIRDNITLVEQNCTLFNDTIRNNILITRDPSEKCDAILKYACQLALLDRLFFDLPNGLDTLIGSGGISLSGGQQQRVALARAIVRDTSILILDEATSALDAIHRELLIEAIRTWRKDKTTIILTHELNQLLDDDYVYVMEKGTIKEYGYKKDLLLIKDSEFFCLNTFQLIDHMNTKNYIPSRDETDTDDQIIKTNEKNNTSFDSQLYSNDEFSMLQTSNVFSLNITIDYLLSGFTDNSYMPRRAKVIRSGQNLDRPSKISGEKDDLESQKIDNRPKLMSLNKIMKRMIQTINRKWFVIIGLICALISGVLNPIFSFAFSKLLNHIVPNTNEHNTVSYLLKWSLIIISIIFLDSIFTFLKNFILDYCSEYWIMNLRNLAMEKISYQDLTWFSLDINNSSEITALILNDLRDLRSLISNFLTGITTLIVISSLGFLWAIISGWKLSLVCISLFPLFILFSGVYGSLLQNYETNYKTSVAELENLTYEIIKNIKTIKCLQLENHFHYRYRYFELRMKTISRKRAIATGFGIATLGTLTLFVQAILFYYGIKLVMLEEYTTQKMLETFTLLLLTIMSCISLVNQIPDIGKGQRAATYIFRLIDEKLPDDTCYDLKRILPIMGSKNAPLICIQNLTFAYPSASNIIVFRGLNLEIFLHEIIGIVGMSGSGKTTLGALLTGLYSSAPDTIKIDGTDINKWNISYLRSYITVVEQVPKFMHGTIRENLLYGLSKKSNEKEIFDCLKLCGIYDFIWSLPDKLETKIETNSISGGQAQRLSIVRALLHRPKILILDEITSALDAENAYTIAQLVKHYLKGITIIVITHSDQMMKICHRIAVLKQGKISEHGTFEELYQLRGELYRTLASNEM